MYLGKQLNFDYHIKEKISKASKRTGVICRLNTILARQSLITVCKFFAKRHLDYCDTIFDQPNNKTFCNLITKDQYCAALTIKEHHKLNYIKNLTSSL